MNSLKGKISWQHSISRGCRKRKSCYFLSIDFNSLWTSEISNKAMTVGVCHIFSILTLTYGFHVSQPKTLMAGICGFRLTVFWWASCEDSICWWEKSLQAERNIMTKYHLVHGHNWERYDLRRKFDIYPILWLMLKRLSSGSTDFTVTIQNTPNVKTSFSYAVRNSYHPLDRQKM